MTLDRIIRNALLAGTESDRQTVDIGISKGIIVAIEPRLAAEAAEHDAHGKLVSPGLIESHFHLDKALAAERTPNQPNRMMRDHMQRTASIKHTFTAEDTYARARDCLEQCLLHGITHMRTQVEVDPNCGLIGFDAIEQLRKDYAWAIDLQVCVFLQEGWTDVPGADENLVTCMDKGARVIGGAMLYDKDGAGQIRRVFDLARHYDADVDLHLDGGFDTSHFDYPQVCEAADAIGWQGRVAFGHGLKFSCLPVAGQIEVGKRLAASDVSLAVLPATDLFNAGRHMEHSVIRGVTDANTLIEQGANCTIATNNVRNAYTPYGDCSLTRIVNLYANVVQRYGPTDLNVCFDMIDRDRAARALRLPDDGIAIGNAADLVVWNEASPAAVIETCAQPLASFKRGRTARTTVIAKTAVATAVTRPTVAATSNLSIHLIAGTGTLVLADGIVLVICKPVISPHRQESIAMPSEDNPLITHKRGHSLHLTMNRRAKKNAISNAMLDAIAAALADAQRDDDVRTIVLTGTGAVFSSGRDIKEFSRASRLQDQSLDGDQAAFAAVIMQLSDMPKPTIAAVRGYAFGGAQALSLACDFVIAEDSTKFGNVEMAFGFPAAMNTVLLARHVGRRMGLEIAMTGEPYTAQRYYELGLVNRLAPDGELDSVVETFVDLLNSRAPWAVARTKSTFRMTEEMTLGGAVHTGTQLNQLLMLSSQTTPVHSNSAAHATKAQTPTNQSKGK